jgi:hypothetical protein
MKRGMAPGFRERPSGLLTRHFFHALFDFGIFGQEGADSFVRVLIGLFSALLALGFLLVRMYAAKYGGLFGAPTGRPYEAAVLADTTLAIALPMWIVAFVTVLVSHSLFPDETDFRVLMPLPVSRPMVFGAKLLALGLFAGLFTVTAHIAITPLVALISAGRWRLDALPLSLLAFWISSVGASSFAVLAVAAVNGLLTMCVPRAYVHGAAAITRSAMIGALVLVLPLVLALPVQSVRLAAHSPIMFLAPPTWFLGVDRLVLGHRDAYFLQLAQVASLAFVAAGAIAAGSYIALYRRFDRVMLRSFGVSRQRRRLIRWPVADTPALEAVRDFTSATLRRSALHQGVIVGLSACGVALALNSLLRSELLPWIQGIRVVRQREIFETAGGMPFVLIFILGIAARATLVLPVEPKANWVFRMTEADAIRSDELRAAERVITLFAALVPTLLTFPVQWLVAGPRALVTAAMTAGFGLLWAEVLLHDWRRIPFACSYLPGKHTVAQTTIAGLGIFLTFGTIIGAMEFGALRSPRPTAGIVVATILLVATALMRWRRRRLWSETPLMFTDELPTDVQVLTLN